VAIAALARFSHHASSGTQVYECLAVLRSDLAVDRCKPLQVASSAPGDTPSVESPASMEG
jgi:hypothetical protein